MQNIDRALRALDTVVDPQTGHGLIRDDRVRDLQVESGISLTIVLDDPSTPFATTAADAAKKALRAEFGDEERIHVSMDNAMISLGADVDGEAELLAGVKHVIAVASGKGGVGKSTVAVNLAVSLARQGYAVGLVDTDIYGPSVPTMMGLEDAKPRVDDERRIIPIERFGVHVLSMGFLVDPDKAVIWRGPMVSSAVRQFLGETAWGELDFLVMDLPPGTGDIQLTIVQTVPLSGAVVVSTPQRVALADARKGIAMFQQVDVPVLGVVENMAYFEPPELPGKRYHLFGEGGARALAEAQQVPLLGELPIQEALREACDTGAPAALEDGTPAQQAFDALAGKVAQSVQRIAAQQSSSGPIEILHG